MLLRPEPRFLRGGGTGGGVPSEGCDVRLLEDGGLALEDMSGFSSSCSCGAGRSVDSLRPYCEFGRRDGGGGGGAIFPDRGGGLSGSSASLDSEYFDELLRVISGLLVACFWLFRRASGGGGGFFEPLISELLASVSSVVPWISPCSVSRLLLVRRRSPAAAGSESATGFPCRGLGGGGGLRGSLLSVTPSSSRSVSDDEPDDSATGRVRPLRPLL